MTRVLFLFSLLFLLPVTAMAQNAPDQVLVRDIEKGEGDTAIDGARLVVQYVGFLSDGTPFDSSYERGTPFSFTLGGGEVIRGWDLGIKGMRVGGRRELIVPPSLAYGEKGAGDKIPGNATLRFEIELMKAEASTFKTVTAEALKGELGTSLTVVDIRTDSHRKSTGSIEGALGLAAFDETGKLNRKFMASLLRHAKKTDAIVLVDTDGRRARFLGGFLTQNADFKDLRGLEGGMDAWKRKGFALTK